MARPTTQHKGFLIPNAGDVASPKMAEPDRIDFNTLGNARFGVIEGCDITVSGSTATNVAGTAIVNGALVIMAGGQNADLGAAGNTQDRYDLLTVDKDGLLKVVQGTRSSNPVYPDPPTTATVLAAVFCPVGASSLSDNVIDKRTMLPMSLLTKIDPAASLVKNSSGTGDLFTINGSGTTVWGSDTILQKTAAKTLRLSDNLNLDGDLAVGDTITATTVSVTGKISGSNLRTGPNDPNGPPSALLGSPGDLYQRTNGQLYINKSNSWMELATVASAIPVGTVLTSLVAPSAIGAGWVPLDGHTVVQETVTPSLFGIPALNSYMTGLAGSRSMTMPDATDRVLLGDFTTAGTRAGLSTIAITLANLPPHKHGVTVSDGGGASPTARTSPSGRHGHSTLAGSGLHGHNVTDPGHAHNGMDAGGGIPSGVVALYWGGQNKIDAYFNDRSHTYSVEALDWTMPAFTNIAIGETGSSHIHTTDTEDDHTHLVTVDSILPHGHTVTESSVGSGTAINYKPLFLSVYVYIRS